MIETGQEPPPQHGKAARGARYCGSEPTTEVQELGKSGSKAGRGMIGREKILQKSEIRGALRATHGQVHVLPTACSSEDVRMDSAVERIPKAGMRVQQSRWRAANGKHVCPE
eukprot:IDg12322t1